MWQFGWFSNNGNSMLAISLDYFLDHASLDMIFITYMYMYSCSFSMIYQITNAFGAKVSWGYTGSSAFYRKLKNTVRCKVYTKLLIVIVSYIMNSINCNSDFTTITQPYQKLLWYSRILISGWIRQTFFHQTDYLQICQTLVLLLFFIYGKYYSIVLEN